MFLSPYGVGPKQEMGARRCHGGPRTSRPCRCSGRSATRRSARESKSKLETFARHASDSPTLGLEPAPGWGKLRSTRVGVVLRSQPTPRTRASRQIGAIHTLRKPGRTTAPTIRAVAFLFTLDTTCVIAMAKTENGNRPDEVAAIARLIDMARDGRIELQLTVAYDRDFDRYRAPEGRSRQLEWLSKAPILDERASGLFVIGVSVLDGPDVTASDQDAGLYERIRSILDPGFNGDMLRRSPVATGETNVGCGPLDCSLALGCERLRHS